MDLLAIISAMLDHWIYYLFSWASTAIYFTFTSSISLFLSPSPIVGLLLPLSFLSKMDINIKKGGCIPLVIIMSISDLMCWHIPCLQPHKTCNTFTWSSRNLPILFISLDLLAMLLVTSICYSIQVSTRQAHLMHILCFYWCSQLEESANDFFGKFQWFLSCNLISNLFNLSLSLSLSLYIYIYIYKMKRSNYCCYAPIEPP